MEQMLANIDNSTVKQNPTAGHIPAKL